MGVPPASLLRTQAQTSQYGCLTLVVDMSDIDSQDNHPEHLQQHLKMQRIQHHALCGDVDVCKQLISELPEYQRDDTIQMLRASVREHGRELNI